MSPEREAELIHDLVPTMSDIIAQGMARTLIMSAKGDNAVFNDDNIIFISGHIAGFVDTYSISIGAAEGGAISNSIILRVIQSLFDAPMSNRMLQIIENFMHTLNRPNTFETGLVAGHKDAISFLDKKQRLSRVIYHNLFSELSA